MFVKILTARRILSVVVKVVILPKRREGVQILITERLTSSSCPGDIAFNAVQPHLKLI